MTPDQTPNQSFYPSVNLNNSQMHIDDILSSSNQGVIINAPPVLANNNNSNNVLAESRFGQSRGHGSS